jgi:hypothetical protein
MRLPVSLTSHSVFLRALELYTGILFLTTNRIGVLDGAFMSRIHTQLYYPPLEEAQSIKIWETNLRKLQKRKRDTMQMNIEQILHFARRHFDVNADKTTRWNGRQIRNACQAAAAMAEYEAFGMHDGLHTPDVLPAIAKLEVRHFEKVVNGVREFYDYMTDICGEDFSGIAKMRYERADDFEPPRARRHQEYQAVGPMPRSAYSSEPALDPYSAAYATPRSGSLNPHELIPRNRWSSFSRSSDESRF